MRSSLLATGEKLDIPASQSLANFVSSGTVGFTDAAGKQHLLYFPSYFSQDPILDGLHYVIEGQKIELLETLQGFGNARDVELVYDDWGRVNSLFLVDHGLEYPNREWPFGFVHKFELTPSGELTHQQISDFKAFNHSVDLSDLNTDGLPDLIVLHMGQRDAPFESWHNLNYFVSNTGGYSTQEVIFANAEGAEVGGGGAVIFADLDGDGQEELIQGNYQPSDEGDWGAWGALRVLDFDPSGVVNIEYSIGRNGISQYMGISGLETVDIDSDGDLDVISYLEGSHPDLPDVPWSGQAVQIYENRGGQLVDPSAKRPDLVINNQVDSNGAREGRMIDLTFDGDVELFRNLVGGDVTTDAVSALATFDGWVSLPIESPQIDFSPNWNYQGHMFTRVVDLDLASPSFVSFFIEDSEVFPIVWTIEADHPLDILVEGVERKIFGSAWSDRYMMLADTAEINAGGGLDYAAYELPLTGVEISTRYIDDSLKFRVGGADFEHLLTDIERLDFTDCSVAFDIEGSAGQTAKTLAAVIGADGLSNKEYVGIGLQLFDAGQSLSSVCELALTAVGATSHADVVNLLYTNLFGEASTEAQAQEYVSALDAGVFTKGSLAAAAAELTDDLGVIDLVGLAETGIEYV